MASVHKAFDPRFKRYVAIKVLDSRLAVDPQFRERFESEMVTLAQLEHPNIAQIHDSGEEHDLFYMVLQFFPGGDLRARMNRPYDVPEALSILKPIAAALRVAHGRNIVHRDLKPANILFADDGRPILSDFGIAKILESEGLTRGLTGTGVGLGSPEYMSPEQVTGEPVDPRSDVYSFGIVLYHMLVGSPPFSGDTPIAVAHKHVYDPFPRPALRCPGMPQAAEEIILKCVARDPGDRYRNGSEVLATLESLTAERLRVPVRLETPPVEPDDTVPLHADAKSAVAEKRSAGSAAVGKRGTSVRDAQYADSNAQTRASKNVAAHDSGDRQSPSRARVRRLAPAAFVLLAIALLLAIGLYRARKEPSGDIAKPGVSEPDTKSSSSTPAETPKALGKAAIIPQAILTVRTQPLDAAVSLDGGVPTKGPLVVFDSLEAGAHRLRVYRAGYTPDERDVSLSAAQNRDVEVQLSRIENDSLGTVVVRTTPDGASVTIRADGRVLTGRSPATFASLPAGSVSLRVEKERYQPQERTVRLSRGETRNETFQFVLEQDPTGAVEIQTNAEAAIYVDGALKRSGTRVSLTLSTGAHDVRIERLGFEPKAWTRLAVEPNKTIVLSYEFPLDVPGRLSVIHAGPWANVFLDGRSTGKTTPNVLAEISPGEHTVSLKRDGFFANEVSKKVVVISGKTIEVDFTGTMEPLPR